jgi:hypothetical protein
MRQDTTTVNDINLGIVNIHQLRRQAGIFRSSELANG